MKHIVFNIDGTLVQQIPQKSYTSFTNKDQMIKVEEGKSLYYYIYPKIPHLLNYLQSKNQFVIHFMTTRSKDWADAVLGSINLPKPIQATLSSFLDQTTVNKVFTEKDLTNGKLDLRKITNDLKNVLVITTTNDVVVDSQKENEFFLGKGFFYFETYAQAKSERESLAAGMKVNIPATEEEWFVEQNKSSFIYQVLMASKALTSQSLIKDIQKMKSDKVELTKKGQLVSRFDFQEKVLQFKFNAKKTKVLGCGIYNPIQDKFLEDRGIDDCLKVFSIKYRFRFSNDNSKAEACELHDEATDAVIKEAPDFKNCLSEINSDISYHWIGKKRAACGSNIHLSFIQDADISLCQYSHVVQDGGKTEIRFFFEVDGKPIAMLNEIATLKPGSTFTLEAYKYDSRLIALSLIQWLRIQKNEINDGQADYDFFNDTRVIMAFNFKDFSNIKTNGFLNQHETGTSGGSLSQSRRYHLENDMINLLLEPSYSGWGNNVHKLRPKYSYLMLDKFREDMGLNTIYQQYGNVFAVFKNQIKYRSTFTPGDSLGILAKFNDVRTFWYRSLNVLKMTSANHYFETQIWGKVELSELDYFLVNCLEPLNADQIMALKNTGRPVFDCKASYHKGNSRPYNLNKTNLL